jgi:Polysaccharide deacetylase
VSIEDDPDIAPEENGGLDGPGRRGRPPRQRPPVNYWPRRLAALAAIGGVVAVLVVIVSGSGGRAGPSQTTPPAGSSTSGAKTKPVSNANTALAVPVLVYKVIATAPASTSTPDIYVSPTEFSDQMQALKAAGWHAVTLNQLHDHWAHGKSLGTSKPFVITFDVGFHSQYATALPILKPLGWVADEDLQVNGFPTSEGGISQTEVKGLTAAGWELDAGGVSAPNLVGLGSSQLQSETAGARQTIQQTYGGSVNWFAYPSGAYDTTVAAAVKAAGYLGGLTTAPGWASGQQDSYRLPRLAVKPGTSGSALLAQIAGAQHDAAPPSSSSG